MCFARIHTNSVRHFVLQSCYTWTTRGLHYAQYQYFGFYTPTTTCVDYPFSAEENVAHPSVSCDASLVQCAEPNQHRKL
eukprot:6357429-Pyramimonas_sp.AAC.1